MLVAKAHGGNGEEHIESSGKTAFGFDKYSVMFKDTQRRS